MGGMNGGEKTHIKVGLPEANRDVMKLFTVLRYLELFQNKK